MIDHIAIGVANVETSKAFFELALAPLGMRVLDTAQQAVSLGRHDYPTLWLDAKLKESSPMHLAFVAESRAQVDAFHRAALDAGATSSGAPGIREHYDRDYYAALVISPEGHNVEAVCRKGVT